MNHPPRVRLAAVRFTHFLAAFFRDAAHFGEDVDWVVNVLEDLMTHDYIETPVFEGEGVCVAGYEGYVGDALGISEGAGLG
ncbi:hypothetical protein CNMCM5793_008972 [Aspergillus hiratsukae]|uniref:Uncharacterized protein n=1 Tax=Aspergillus hiratsukae TaxID=1194566 RepID=A0A8H6UJ24_9EURO|nr:hypothetical protein CNMCM5793_008972 [Aspergillus hiratsukae]